MDWGVIVVIVLIFLALGAFDVFLLIYYIHSQDSNFGQSVFPKIVIVM